MVITRENDILFLKMDGEGNNIMTSAFLDEFIPLLEEAESYASDSSVKGLVIYGAGRHFSCGADVPSLLENTSADLEELSRTNKIPEGHLRQKGALTKLNSLPFPVVSMVKGFCIGSGCEIAANSHIRVCEPSARIGQPESTFGILPALGGIAKTAEICGLSDAVEMVLTGTLYGAAEAEARDWADISCAKNQGLDTAVELIEFINKYCLPYDRTKTAEYTDKFTKFKAASVKGIKKIGVIGYGKMGKEIFSLLHDGLTGAEFTVICRHDAESNAETVSKNLAKALKRGRISEFVHSVKSTNFAFTDDLKALSDCDLIIESVSEDPAVKKSLFAELDGFVKESCIFATNTSSLEIDSVFSEVKSHSNRMGMHFFYPVKLNGFIEFNNCDDEKTASEICNVLKKEPIFFRDRYCFYLNQYIYFCLSCGMLLRDRYALSTEQFMNIASELFPQHSLFGMADSIGLGLLTAGDSVNHAERIIPVNETARNKFISLINDGCPAGTGEFLSYISENETDCDGDIPADKIMTELTALILNEAVCAACDCGEAVIGAVSDATGLAEPMKSYYEKYGYDKISSVLAELSSSFGFSAFEAADKSDYDRFFV